MSNEQENREFRLKPPRKRHSRQDEARIWSTAFVQVMRMARMSRSKLTASTSPRPRPSYMHRCAVRVSYSRNRIPGQWAAHGRYVTRNRTRAFGRDDDVNNLPHLFASWQKDGDERLFKLIISPEFGERVDLEELTRDLMDEMERDLGTKLQWIAAIHHDTEHSHAHVALRGLDDKGRPLRLPREYVQHGIRNNAENLVTAQLGYRTLADAEESQHRDVHQKRYTSLDRIINRQKTGLDDASDQSGFVADLTNVGGTANSHHVKARLLFLQDMGLCDAMGPAQWLVRSDFDRVLRALQTSADRQRALADHQALISDIRMPMVVTDCRNISHLEGRIITHGEDEMTGRIYMILEGTDRKIHFVYHTAEMEEARYMGLLERNSFVRITRDSSGCRAVSLEDLGDAEGLLKNKTHLRKTAAECLKRGIIPAGTGCGWLGKYPSRGAAFTEGPGETWQTPLIFPVSARLIARLQSSLSEVCDARNHSGRDAHAGRPY
jgi:hypothetical protein